MHSKLLLTPKSVGYVGACREEEQAVMVESMLRQAVSVSRDLNVVQRPSSRPGERGLTVAHAIGRVCTRQAQPHTPAGICLPTTCGLLQVIQV